MNERMIQLAKEAGLKVYSDKPREIDRIFFASVDEKYQKFAELIIEECISKIELQRSSGENTDQWTITRDMCYLSMIADLKNHFGMTE